MHALRNPERLLTLLLLPMLLPLQFWAAAVVRAEDVASAAGIVVQETSTTWVEDHYLLDARIDYRLSTNLIEALENGVPLTFEVQAQALEDLFGLWRQPIASHSRFYRLEYHALSEQYLTSRLDEHTRTAHASLDVALATLGSVVRMPLVTRAGIKADAHYFIRLRARLDVSSLPTPLRLTAYLNQAWRLQSEWRQWPLAE
jgi:hypothetical protein